MITQAQSNSLVAHAVEKSTQALMNDYNLPLDEAFSFVYNSATFNHLNDELSGLRAQSSDYIYELLKEEFEAKNLTLPT